MSVLKKPVVAAILCVLVVLLSTVISVRARLNPQCDEISESFTRAGGIAEQLTAVCDAGAGLAKLAEGNGIESEEAEDLCMALRLAAAHAEPSSLVNLYQMTLARANDLKVALQRADLSEKDAALLEEYSAKLTLAQAIISADPYNSQVKGFLQDLGGFSRGMARLCGVKLPEQFA